MRRLAAAAIVLALLAGCSSVGARPPATEILVFAAASLTESFGAIAGAFHAEHPEASVRFNFGPSGGLATQIGEGAPADVLASASSEWMDAIANDPGVSDRATFARNRLVLLVPRPNTAKITGLQDLARAGVKLVLAAEGVPAGLYARDALTRGGIAGPALRNLVSNEEDVKGVVQKILLDEADAGIAYRSDLTPSVKDRVQAIEIPDRWNVTASYSIAVVGSSVHRDAARAFVRFVLGPAQAVLRSFGFLAP